MITKDLILLNGYKEPLKEVKKGYGYYGTVAITSDRENIQCHDCGRLFKNLSFHVCVHGMTLKEYKTKYGLSAMTSLTSENYREQQKLRLAKTLSNPKYMAKLIRNRKSHPPKGHYISLEERNKRGNCPDQLLDYIKKVSIEIGHTPSVIEFKSSKGMEKFVPAIYRTYGSWKKALELIGLESKKKQYGARIFSKEQKYSDEMILEYLYNFWKTNNSVPTGTDSKRGLIPAMSCYKRFGGIIEARRLSGIPNWQDMRGGFHLTS